MSSLAEDAPGIQCISVFLYMCELQLLTRLLTLDSIYLAMSQNAVETVELEDQPPPDDDEKPLDVAQVQQYLVAHAHCLCNIM